MPVTFVFNDETQVNTHGFRIPNAGGKFERFDENPQMLEMHNEWSLDAILGNWKNRRIEGVQLLGEPNFNLRKKRIKEIAQDVDDGFVKACSMGIIFDPDKMVMNELDGVFDLTEWELLEVSLVAIGSNGKALVRLYNKEGELMSDDEVKLSLSALSGTKPQANNSKTDTMKEFKLSAQNVAFLTTLGGLTNAEDSAAVNSAIAKLSTDLTTAQKDLQTEKNDHNTLKEKVQKQLQANAKRMIEEAEADGRLVLTADQKSAMLKSAVETPDVVTQMLSILPAKQTLGETTTTPTGSPASAPQSVDDFVKLSLKEQLAFKEQNPDAYAKLFA